MNPFLRPVLVFAVAAIGVPGAHASFFVDPAGGTVLWSDDASYDDTAIRGRSLGFDFTFFDNEPVTAINVSSNGNLNFIGDFDYSNERLLEPILRISPLWDDLEVVPGSGDSVIEKVVPGKLYSVAWTAHEHGKPGTRHSFQVVIFGAAQRINGQDFVAGDILFSYGAIGATFAKDIATVCLDSGDGGVIVPVPGASVETGRVLHSEAGLLPTGAGGYILFHPDDSGGYIASTHINHLPQAFDDTLYTTSRGRVAIDVLANDSDPDGDPLVVESVTQGAFGNVMIADSGAVIYVPGPAFVGTDIFTCTVRDPLDSHRHVAGYAAAFRGGPGGVFDGLIADAPTKDDPQPVVTTEGSGYLRLMLTGNGGFTGILHYGGFAKVLRGTFDARGHFAMSFDRVVDEAPQTVTLTLHLDLTNENRPLTGTVTDGTFTSDIVAARSRFAARSFPTGQAGKYTVLLRPDETGSGPLGIGYSLMKVTPGGAAVLGGRAGDGKPFTFGGRVKADGTFPLFLRLPAGKGVRAGSLFGVVKFDDSHPTCDCSATLQWFMPDVGDVSGFEAAPQFIGSRYRPPARGQRVIPLADSAKNAAVDLGDGQITGLVTFWPSNKVTVEAPNAEQLSVTVNAAAGTFGGAFFEESFDIPPIRKRRAFGGVFLKKLNVGGGLYLDAEGHSAAVKMSRPRSRAAADAHGGRSSWNALVRMERRVPVSRGKTRALSRRQQRLADLPHQPRPFVDEARVELHERGARVEFLQRRSPVEKSRRPRSPASGSAP